MKWNAKRIAFTGVLAALALVLSVLESLLPAIPGYPPGARLGLSNIAVMYTASAMGLPSALCIALIKGAFALFSRGGVSGLMSLLGGVCSTLVMWLCLEKTKMSLILIGVLGSLTHNLAQLLTARWLTSTTVLFYIPPMLVIGILAGILTGIALKITLPVLKKAAALFHVPSDK